MHEPLKLLGDDIETWPEEMKRQRGYAVASSIMLMTDKRPRRRSSLWVWAAYSALFALAILLGSDILATRSTTLRTEMLDGRPPTANTAPRFNPS